MLLPDNDQLKYFAKKAAIGAAVGVGAVALPGIVLGVTGFSSGGVIPGSIAAAWQSSIGNVAVGSLFAACQSAGAAGVSLTTMATLGTVGFVRFTLNSFVACAKEITYNISRSTNARTAANGTVYGIKLVGSGISCSSKYLYGVVKSKL